MSSRIIEAKFQALDRTIQQLGRPGHRTILSSCEQLRELAYNNQRVGSLPSVQPQILNKTSRSSSKAECNSQKPPCGQRRSSGPSTLLPSTTQVRHISFAHDPEPVEWKVPKYDRDQQILQDAWNEIESAISGTRCAELSTSNNEDSFSTKVNLLTPKVNTNEIDAKQPSPSNQDICNGKSAARTPSRHKIRTIKAPKVPNSFRCQSADPSRKPSPRQSIWFSSIPKSRPSTSCSESTRKKSLLTTNTKESKTSTTPESPQLNLILESNMLPSDTMNETIDNPSFYFLEVRLEHATPLKSWRFRATFTDISLPSRPTITLDKIPVNEDNCLLFPGPGPSKTAKKIKYFDPLRYFCHVNKPRELYGHCIRILVRSTIPEERVVIDTLVSFIEETEDSIVVSHPSPQTPSESAIVQPSDQPTLSTLLPPVQGSTLTKASSVDSLLSTHKSTLLHQDTSIQPIQFSGCGWEDENDVKTKPHNDAVSTIEKKKIQLDQMRASMRRKLHDEQHQLSHTHAKI